MNFWARIAASLLAATFVWLLAPKAFAAAPLCDARGAIMFAPPPTLEEPNASIDVGDADDCGGAAQTDVAFDHGQHGSNARAAAEDGTRALVASSPVILPASCADVLEDTASMIAPPSGVTSRLDRPPR